MPTRVVFDEWEVYHAETRNGPVFISFDVEATRREDLDEALPHCARLLIPVKNPNEVGGPVEPESERLYDMEDQVCELLAEHNVDCRLVGRLTHRGMRELVFQVADWESFRPPVGLWMGSNPDYDVDVSEHEGWDFFNDFICPSDDDWLLIMDRQVIDQLQKAGSDLAKEHSLEFVFYGDPPRLAKAAEALRSRGYENNSTDEGGRLIAVKLMLPHLNDVFQESLANRRLGEELGIDYEGWGCAVVP